MTTAYTSLLGLALPVTGELSGTWGDTVNNSITSLLDNAVAGTTTLSTDADVTLTTTTGASNEARQAIILWTASGTVTRNITAPAQSKIYTVINATGSTQSIVIRGAGPTTGVTIPAGCAATVAWNGSDFVDISSTRAGMTLRGNLLFSADATYDIGASGATRPRSVYASANGVFAGGLGLSGNAADPTNYSIVASKQMLVQGTDLGYRSVNTANTSAIGFAANTGTAAGGTLSADGGPVLIYAGGSTRAYFQSNGVLSVGCNTSFGQPVTSYTGLSLAALNGAGNFGTYGPRADITVTRVENWKTEMGFAVNTVDTDSAPTQVGLFNKDGNFGVGATSLNLLGGTRCITINAPTSGNYSSVELSTDGALRAYFSGNSSQTYLSTYTATPLTFGTSGTERMTIGSTGYFTFSGSNASFKGWGAGLDGVIQISSYSSLFSTSGLNNRWANNVYFDGTNYKQIASGTVAFVSLNDNAQSFYVSTQASAGAGSTVTPYSKFKVDGGIGGTTSSCQIQLGPDRSGSDSARLTMRYDSTTLSAQDFIRINNRNYGTTAHYVGGIVFSAYRDVRDPCDIAAVTAYRNSAAGGLSSNGELRFHTGGGNSIEVDGVLPDIAAYMYNGGDFQIAGANATKASGTAWINPSDARLKENVKPYAKGLNELMQIEFVSGEYNGLAGTTKGQKFVSVIAQQVQPILEDSISTYKEKMEDGSDGDIEYLRYDATETNVLVAVSVQQLAKMVKDLQQEIANLKGAQA